MPLFDPSIQSISAGTTRATSQEVVFANSNGVSFGVSGQTITASVQTGTGLVGIAAGTQTATSGTVVFSNSNGISFGMSNGSIVTAQAATTPVSVFSQWGGFETNYSLSAGRISYQKVSLPMPISGSSGVVLADLFGHSNSSGGITFYVAAYAISGGTAGTITTASGGFSWTSGTATTVSTIYGGVSGTRYRSFGWAVSMTPGDYLFAVAISTTNDGTARIFGRQGVNIVGSFAGAETRFFIDGVSISTSGAFPLTVAASDTKYVRTGLSAAQQPGFILIGTF